MTAGTDERQALYDRVVALIDRLADGRRDDEARDALLCDLMRHQVPRIEPWRRLVAAGGLDVARVSDLPRLPALPTDVFRHARVAIHPPTDDVRVFRTSGTTTPDRGVHPLCDLSLYDHAARAAARYALFPDMRRIRLVVLAPDEHEAPDSSLSYMLARFGTWFGAGASEVVWRRDELDARALQGTLARATANREPVGLLGTSFAFIHAEDTFDRTGSRFALPPGSRLMHTGGTKGRSREMQPEALRARLVARYGVPPDHVVVEYGMTELSSQMYETSLIDARRGLASTGELWVPGWMRATPVDPETLEPVPEGEVGILRLCDAANLDTPCAIQTADLARRTGDRIVLLGRAPGAVPRGCSLAVEEALGGAT